MAWVMDAVSSCSCAMELENENTHGLLRPPGRSRGCPLKGRVMRGSRESYPPNLGRELLFLAAFLSIFCLLPATAQKARGNEPSAPKYDPHTETKLSGTVEEAKLPPKGSEKDIVHLMVKSGTEIVDVYLCPKSFLDDMGVTFSKGDEVEVTGSKVKQDGADLVLAREVVKGNDALVLRDAKGDPVWSWQNKK